MNNSIVKDIFEVTVSNFVVLLGSICTGFIIPLMLGATNYGYYKMFILYSTYVALLHFGFVDGILLLDGGKDYENLNHKQFRANSQFFILFQLIISILLSISSVFVYEYFTKVLLITLGVYTFIFNVMTYYQFISQATMQFKQLSLIQAFQPVLNIIMILVLYLSYKLKLINRPKFLSCIVILLIVVSLLCVWYIYTYRNITFGPRNGILKTFNTIFKYFKYGIYITISYQISMLVINLDNQFVSWFFGAYVYGIYAFAYSLVYVINTILSSISNVLLPHLKQIKHRSRSKMLNMYPTIISGMLLVIFFLFIGYFPIEYIIKIFLIKYVKSLIYFRILLPGIAINCCISLVIFAYYNALDRSKRYFIISVFMLIISVILYSISYLIFNSVVVLALTSIIMLIIWMYMLESYLVRKYQVKWIKNTIYMSLMILLFYIFSGLSDNFVVGMILYSVAYLLMSYIMFKNILINYCYKILIKFNSKDF